MRTEFAICTRAIHIRQSGAHDRDADWRPRIDHNDASAIIKLAHSGAG